MRFVFCSLLCLILPAAAQRQPNALPLTTNNLVTGLAQEIVLHAFTGGKDGLRPSGGLAIDQSGTLYGTTGDNSTVFALQPGSAGAWTEHILFSFGSNCCNAEGTLLLDASGNIYGTTEVGGDIGGGTAFELTRTGSAWSQSVLHSFLGNPDGYYPYAGLIFDPEGNLYGTTVYGGVAGEACNGCGTVYELSPGTSGTWTESVLYSFSGGSDGAYPEDNLILDGAGNLYGTASQGGAYGNGTVFKLARNSAGAWDQTVLYAFTGKTDGANPVSSLTFGPDGNLYGTTDSGGAYGYGTVFRLTPTADGMWQENVLHSFTNGADGGYPLAGVVFDSQGNIYGTAYAGTSTGYGAVFELRKSGGSYVEHTLYSFLGESDGGNPDTQLVLDGAGNLFGTTFVGGTINKQQCKTGCGAVFEIIP